MLRSLEWTEPLSCAVGPVHHCALDFVCISESEVHPWIVARSVTIRGLNGSPLARTTGRDLDPGNQGVTPMPVQDTKHHPLAHLRMHVFEKASFTAIIRDRNIDVAVVVEIPEGGATTILDERRAVPPRGRTSWNTPLAWR